MAQEQNTPKLGIPRKTLIKIGLVAAAVWAFAIQTRSVALMIVVGVLTAIAAALLVWVALMARKQRRLLEMMQSAATSPDARRDTLAKLDAAKDAGSPTMIFARAQLLAGDDPKAALALLEGVELKTFPPAMQDDVSLLTTQLYLSMGRTSDARRSADKINLDNPERKAMRPLSAVLVAEAWARSGKPKDALGLLETIGEVPEESREQIELQSRYARVFARFAAQQRGQTRSELVQLADLDVNNLGRFVDPRFRVHPELQKLARHVLETHPAARKLMRGRPQRR